MKAKLAVATAVAVGVAVLGACSGDDRDRADDAGAPGAAAEVDGDAFYAPPDPLPGGEHGDLIRHQRIDGGPVAGATRWRIMYLSESPAGEPIAVTGTVTVPDGPAPEGGRDVVAVAHGTTGLGDDCAPSRWAGDSAGPGSELAVAAGYVTAATDYEGLGTPGRHPYLVGESEGRGVLDAALAAGQLPGVAVSGRLAIIGYSQGGHAALWAGQLAAEWTPDLDVVGTVSGAPVTELPVVLSSADTIPIADYLYLIIAGLEAAYPDEADPALLLSPDGVAAVDAADDEGCAPRALASTADMPPAGELVDGPGSVEPWATLLAANDPGRVATDTPILILHSAADDLVPARLSERLFERMCDLDQQVERRVEHRGEGHGTAGDGMYATGFAWIADRFAGEPATSTCPPAGGDGEGRPRSP